MSRPADWYVLDLDCDPAPGEPVAVSALSVRVGRVAEDASRAERDARGLAGDGTVTTWIGAAGDVFRGALEEFPIQLRKLADSYEQCAGALSGYARALDGAQVQADRALAQGRVARAEVEALGAQLSAARGAAVSAGSAVAGLDRPQVVGAAPPDPEQVRAATRNAQAASSRVASLSDSVGGAQDRLEAAKRMARDARELRENAADRAVVQLRDASDAGIEPNSFWEDFKSAAAKAWKVVVTVATVVAVVVAVLALFVGGPLVWGILLVATAVLLADALTKYANGEGGPWEVALAGLGVIPGGRLLTALGKVVKLGAVGTRAATGLSRGLAAGRASLTRMAAALRNGLGRTVLRLGDDTGSASLNAARSARPTASDPRLKRALADDYRGGPNPIGDGRALDAARHTVQTGDLVGGSTHLEKAVEMRDRYARILRRGGLDATDEAVTRESLEAYGRFVREHRLEEMMRARGIR